MKNNRSTPTENNYHWMIATNKQFIIGSIHNFLNENHCSERFEPMPTPKYTDRQGITLPNKFARLMLENVLTNDDMSKDVFIFRKYESGEVEPIEKKLVLKLIMNEEEETPRVVLDEVEEVVKKKFFAHLKSKVNSLLPAFTGVPLRVEFLQEKYKNSNFNLRHLKKKDRELKKFINEVLENTGFKLLLDAPNKQFKISK